ncbi:hypothetical protein ABMY26_32295 [Azospirillum sp. HJ39]|uniref:hypothetical protein n=1 Tax=Azospirillum sp. HJ39 TaxID=3159496 RepID=UPI003557B409
MMAVFGTMRMGAGKACAIDPAAGSRTFFLRGDGVPGTQPVTDDLGNPLTYYGSIGLSAVVPQKWPDYQSTMRTEQSGRIVMPTAKWDLGIGGAPFSILMRLAIFGAVGPAAGIVVQNGAGASSWGAAGIQNHIWCPSPDLKWEFFGTSSQTTMTMPATSGAWNDHSFRELLITYDGTTTRGYCQGVQVASVTGAYTKVAGTTACVGSDVAGGQSLYMAFNDLSVYGACITTASSYTLPTLPPC